jgi:quinone-modifying oxidoreductase subunit QmoC
MYSFVIRSNEEIKIPFQVYISEAWRLIYHTLTQKRWLDCAGDDQEEQDRKQNKTTWISHLLMVSGYGLMLVLIVFFLQWFQTDEIYPVYHPQRWLGYYATAVILWGAGRAIWGRIKKEVQLHRFSHPSDWFFPALLFTVALTGLLVHTFRYLGWALPTYYTYAIHLAFTAPMLILEVPFGKWSHLYYRPLAIYLQTVKAKAIEQSAIPAGEYTAAD